MNRLCLPRLAGDSNAARRLLLILRGARMERGSKRGGKEMNTTRLVLGCAVLVAAVQLSTATAGAKGLDKLAPDLRRSMTLARDQRVIVTYAQGLDESSVRGLVSKSGHAARRFEGSRLIKASLSRREIEALEI